MRDIHPTHSLRGNTSRDDSTLSAQGGAHPLMTSHRVSSSRKSCDRTIASRKRGRRPLERYLASLLFADLDPPICFVTELLKLPNVPREFGRWGPALFLALASYLSNRRDIRVVHLITRHQDERNGAPFDSTVIARRLFEDLGFGKLQVFDVGSPPPIKGRQMLYELYPGQTYMSVDVSFLLQRAASLSRLKRLCEGAFVVSQSPSIVDVSTRTSYDHEAIEAIRSHHSSIGDIADPEDVLPHPNERGRCFYGFYEAERGA